MPDNSNIARNNIMGSLTKEDLKKIEEQYIKMLSESSFGVPLVKEGQGEEPEDEKT